MKLAAQSWHVFRWVGALFALTVLGVRCSGCYCPWLPFSADAWPFADAWVDANCDGVHENDEGPLPGVCVWVDDWPPTDPSSEYCAWDGATTNEEGRWWGGTVSNTRYYIVALTPRGFQPTSDTAVGSSMHAQFGFAREGTCPPRAVVTPDRLALSESIRFVIWVLPVAALAVLLALGFRKLRRDALARHQARSGE